jgi:Cu-processing system permease protein
MLISVWARDRVRASGTALALWFFFVLVFDLLLMGALVAIRAASAVACLRHC